MSNTEEQIRGFGTRWAEAEQRADTETLETMAVDGFRLVGPLGFVLDKTQWLNRFRGGLVMKSLSWDEVDVREFGDTAIAIGVHTQEGTHQGNPVNGKFRATHVLVRDGGQWRLAGIHLSPVGGPSPFKPDENAR